MQQRRAGILVPLFSVYSQKSLGIGEFDDLSLLVDWCVQTGNTIIQLLPMNEMGAVACPYDSISSFALEPVYINLRDIPAASHVVMKRQIDNLQQSFTTDTRYVDYRLKGEKLRLLWELFSYEGRMHSEECKRFVGENAFWIDDYALYKVLKEINQGKPWYEWEAPFRDRHEDGLDQIRRTHQEAYLFHQWVQWRLYEQFSKVKRYAEEQQVRIKGDLPILVSRDSADVWAHKELFKLDLASGAPPDMYCAKGQRWGMPPYNWHAIAAKKYRYIKEKLRYAESFYHLLRIDHVVGLFRIWVIPVSEPLDNQGLHGFYDPPDEHLWGRHGRTILTHMKEDTHVSFCGEDLGTIPDVCTQTLKEFSIPGIDVQRWTKGWTSTHDFLPSEEYRSLAVAVLSTHDTPNWVAWWNYEAGTVDEAKFMRMCEGRIDYRAVRDRLFDPNLSRYGRLRWLSSVTSVGMLASILGKPENEIQDFIEAYLNTFQEKEKLWKSWGISRPFQETADASLVRDALQAIFHTPCVYAIQLITDLLYAYGSIFKGDPHQYTINRPGTISQYNWSLRMPVSLEELIQHKGNAMLKKVIRASGRVPAVKSRHGKSPASKTPRRAGKK